MHQECFAEVDQFDVTNTPEIVLFFCLLVLATLIAFQIVQSMRIMSRKSERSKILRSVKNVNCYLLILINIEIVQKSQQLSLGIYSHLNPSFRWKVVFGCIHQVTIYGKITILCLCILYTSKIWMNTAKNKYIYLQPNKNQFKKAYIIVRVYLMVSFIFCEIWFFYDCRKVKPREVMLFVSNILVFSIFLYAACLFYLKMHHLASYSFKRSFLAMMIILYIGVLMRAIFYLIQLINHDFWKKIKNFDQSTHEDRGYNWFIFLIFFSAFRQLFSNIFSIKDVQAQIN